MIYFDCRLTRPGFTFDAAFETGPGVTALFGASGSGKSTALRLVAGLERPERGLISLDGERLTDTEARLHRPPHRRRIGFVFQDALLLPHLSVRSNLGYGRFFTRRADRKLSFDAVVQVLGIGHLLDRGPATLSGGERQRVAIGRALLASPRLLLMDEPLASLDAARKRELLPFIERLRDEFAIPILYVSHAAEEVARLASRVVLIEAGRVSASGRPDEVLGAVAPGVDRFDAVSILSAAVKERLPAYGLTMLAHPAGDILVPGQLEPGRTVTIAIRATNVAIASGGTDSSVRTRLKGRIAGLRMDDGPFALAAIELAGGAVLQASLTRLAVDQLGLRVGSEVVALVKTVALPEQGPGPNEA
jgi:molybdate transport system ATP-binding protein